MYATAGGHLPGVGLVPFMLLVSDDEIVHRENCTCEEEGADEVDAYLDALEQANVLEVN